MNANKLADKLQDCYEKDVVIDSAATMLRTIPALQAEIEALKAELKGWNLAWYESNPPHTVKELTDEEIEQCWKQTVKQEFISKVYRFDFARAILRKAQEE